jgi:dolichyl-phosphooligosaccharide-protein glycotransferase
MERSLAARAALVLACIGVVVWLRMLPLSLGVLDQRADQIVRNRIRQQVAGDLPQGLSGAARAAEIERRLGRWSERHRSQFDAERRAEAERLKAELRYTGADGRQHVYLGDYDSYTWLRSARNYLRHGTTADARVNGEPWDTFANAPVGRLDRYSRSLHIAAIVAVHRVMTTFDPGNPLPASSFLVPVIVGALGVLPAFAIGRLLAGTLGGVVAAILIGVNPIFLARSAGSDNDVWNIVLPLFMVWAAVAALRGRTFARQSGYALLAGVFAGLHVATWAGWGFTYVVLLVGLASNALMIGARHAVRSGTFRLWHSAPVRRSILVLVIFYASVGFFLATRGSTKTYFLLPFQLFRQEFPALLPAFSPTSLHADFPDALSTVAELSLPSLSNIATFMDSIQFFFIGWLGLIVLVLPRRHWRWWHFAVLIAGNYLYRYLLSAQALPRSALVALLALPLAAAIALHVFADEDTAGSEPGAGLIVIVWFLATLLLSYRGLRFVMLLVPPFAIAFAVAVGRLEQWLSSRASALPARYQGVARAALFAVLAAVVALPVQRGYAAARGFLPGMNDAWWDTLTQIRTRTPPNAIVTSWWDYGYWVKYVAERRVSADGGSLTTHLPHWIGRAFLAPREREAVGLLRMLDCGSDVSPGEGKGAGAYDTLTAQHVDPIQAHQMIVDLANLDRGAAAQYLASHGLPKEAASRVLASTHCAPPPAYLILSSNQVRQSAWRLLGGWDLERAFIARHARLLPEQEAVTLMTRRLGLQDKDARKLYEQAKALRSAAEVREFIAPRSTYLTLRWIQCPHPADGEDMTCPVRVPIDRVTIIDRVDFRPSMPGESNLHFYRRTGPDNAAQFDGTPALVLVAGATKLDTIEPPSPMRPEIALLVDVNNDRILLGTPDVIRSTFTQLMFLDGRYSEYFEKFSDRQGFNGERVVTWKIDWQGRGRGAGGDGALPEAPGEQAGVR